MGRCPGCGEFSLDNSSRGYKQCLAIGCSYRVFTDGSVSFIRFNRDKIRRVRVYLNGLEENEKEFAYPAAKGDVISKRLNPGYPQFGRKVRLIADLRVNGLHITQASDKVILTNTGVLKLSDTERTTHINPIVPAGTIGIVNKGPFSGIIFDYDFECPVQFINDPRIPKTVGVPWNMLEFAD